LKLSGVAVAFDHVRKECGDVSPLQSGDASPHSKSGQHIRGAHETSRTDTNPIQEVFETISVPVAFNRVRKECGDVSPLSKR